MSLFAIATSPVLWVRRALRVRRERRELAQLSPQQLRDMGITEEMRQVELARAPWEIR